MREPELEGRPHEADRGGGGVVTPQQAPAWSCYKFPQQHCLQDLVPPAVWRMETQEMGGGGGMHDPGHGRGNKCFPWRLLKDPKITCGRENLKHLLGPESRKYLMIVPIKPGFS